ncbi:hypothetical protein AB7M22_001594 [Pseudomonas sp. ADAK2 TE3594]
MCWPHRGQARSHNGWWCCRFVVGIAAWPNTGPQTPNTPVGACPRWRSVSQHQYWMCWPHRGQARSHNGFVVLPVCGWHGWLAKHRSPNTQYPCGSGLARDGGVSANINVGCAGLIAGKPAPTMDLWCCRFVVGIAVWPNTGPQPPNTPVGARLAREDGVSANINIGCAGLIAGKPAPTGFCGGYWVVGNLSSAHNPPPSRLLNFNDPPIAMANCWAIAKPKPVPPVLRLREFSTR